MTFQADTDTREKSWGQQRAWCAQKEEACCHGCCTGASTGVRFGSLSPYYPLLLAKTLLLQPRSFMVYCELIALLSRQSPNCAFAITFSPREVWRKAAGNSRKIGEAIHWYVLPEYWKFSRYSSWVEPTMSKHHQVLLALIELSC